MLIQSIGLFLYEKRLEEKMIDRNTSQQLCYLTEVCRRLHRAGFNVEPLGEHQLSIQWNGSPLCRITEKGSVFYRREDTDGVEAENALLRIEDIATLTLAARCWQALRANTAFNSSHGIGTMIARACPTDTTSWRTT